MGSEPIFGRESEIMRKAMRISREDHGNDTIIEMLFITKRREGVLSSRCCDDGELMMSETRVLARGKLRPFSTRARASFDENCGAWTCTGLQGKSRDPSLERFHHASPR